MNKEITKIKKYIQWVTFLAHSLSITPIICIVSIITEYYQCSLHKITIFFLFFEAGISFLDCLLFLQPLWLCVINSTCLVNVEVFLILA